MDLSQQELPLTAFFTRGNKEARSRIVSCKTDKSTERSQLVARATKRRKSNVESSTVTPSSSSASQSKSRMSTLQLPTPVTSTRKRTYLELAAKTPPTSMGASSSAERNVILSNEEDATWFESGRTPLKLPKTSPEGTKNAILGLPSAPLITPSTDRRRTTKSVDVESHPDPVRSLHRETGIPTPQTSLRRTTKHACGIDDPLEGSSYHSASEANQVSARLPDAEVSHSVPSLSQKHLVHSTTVLSRFPTARDFSDPFYTREKDSVFAQRNGASVLLKQHSPLKILGGQTSDGHAIPVVPVPSSQSQYLLHLDATPKRKRYSQRIERVISSQTQEEQELTLSTPPRTTAMANAGIALGNHARENPLIPGIDRGKRTSEHVYTLSSISLGSPTRPSGTLFATMKALDEPPSPSIRGEKSTPNYSPSGKTKTPRHDSIGSIPPVHIEDSLTESESESDIFQLRMKCKPSALNLSRTRGHSSPGHCRSPDENLAGAEDDSATEAESDTEILHCVAEISKKRPRDHRSQVPREDTPPPPVISPLVSPNRPCTAAVTGSTQFLTQTDARLSIVGSCLPYSSTMERPQMPLESLPAVVRDFIRMFPGDESYPADFPESLRV